MVNTIKHLSYLLGSSEQEISWIINNIDSYYYDKRQPKKKYGKFQRDKNNEIRYRDLCVSRYPLKAIQKNINVLLQKIELPKYAYGSVKDKSNILNAKQHVQGNYFLTIDLKDFFPNINNNQVYEMFNHNNFSPTISRMLTQLTTYRGGLSQGPPSSPIISNLVFVTTGMKLIEAIKGHKITFTTYLDDLTFSSEKDFKPLVPALLEIIKEDGFYAHHKKIHYKSFRTEVTGLIIYKNKLWPIADMVESAKDNLYRTAYIKSIQSANKKNHKDNI